MNTRGIIVLGGLVALAAAANGVSAAPVDTTITYQGKLTEGGANIDGAADFVFRLMDAEFGGAEVAPRLTLNNLTVQDGLFTVDLDFGSGAFSGERRWLEITVRSPAGTGGYTVLSPRQPVTAAPFALYALDGAGASPWQEAGTDITYLGGDVGVGEASPLSPLHIQSADLGVSSGMITNTQLIVEATDAGLRLFSNGAGTTGSAIVLSEVDDGVLDDSWSLRRRTVNAGSELELNHSNGNVMWFEPDGNVGIGTVSPGAKLAVTESSGFAPALSVSHQAGGPAIQATQELGTSNCARFTISHTAGTGTAMLAETAGTGTAGSFTQNNLNASTPTVTINAFADNPNHNALRVITNNSGTAANFFCNDTAGTGDGVIARVRGSGNAGVFTAEGAGTALVANQTSSGHIARFQDAGVDQVVIDSGGDLGIGTSSPLYLLDIHESSGTANVVNIERTVPSVSGADLLQIEAHTDAADDTQFIECERGSDIEFRVWGDGDVTADGTFSGPADFAEMIRASDGAAAVEPGDVMVIDLDMDRAVRRSATARSTLVAGIYSTKPGYLGSEHDWDDVARELLGEAPEAPGEMMAMKTVDLGRMIDHVPLAIVGIVPCKVSAENGAIRPGDLLVTAGVPGHAMRDENPRTGTVVGKALGTLEKGTGVIKVLVTLQ